MTEFVDRLEKELLAAGRRSRGERLLRHARASVVMAVPALLSIGVVAAVAAVLLTAGHPRRTPTGRGGSSSIARCWRPPRNIREAVLPTTDAAPNHALLSLLGILRRPAIAADRVSLRGLVYSPITAAYARYIRVVTDAAGERFALVPAQICGRQNGGPYPARTPGTTDGPQPHDAIFIIVLSAPAPRALFDAGDATAIRAGKSIGQWWPEGDGSMIATVVPDGVSHVVLAFGRRHSKLRMTAQNNLAVFRPSPASIPLGATWFGPTGLSIHRFSFSTDPLKRHLKR